MEKQALREIYEKYGESVISNPRKLRAHLLDMRVPKKSVNLLVDISKIDYFRQFSREIADAPEAREKLVYAVHDEYAFDENAAEFGADCWVYALTGQHGTPADGDGGEKEIWPEEKAELVAAALRELMRDNYDA